MTKTWPTEKQKNKQLLASTLATVVAALDGIVMVRIFSPATVLCEILIASCAVWQWCIYFDIRTKLDIKTILASQDINDSKVHNKPDARDNT